MSSILIFDFNTESNIKQWRVVNDGVMGGISNSSFVLNAEGHAVFKGHVSLENNGGFASVRYTFDDLNVEPFTKAVLRLKGDKKQYQFRLKSSTSDYYSYIYTFETTGDWQEIEIPLKDMHPTFRGRNLDLPNFDKQSIAQIAFLIANKTEESFELMLDKIELK